ncbi:MAG: hypothetical protein HYY60_01930 [Parcubacteria group bacterium]|nr:hypothetical protein [Parcubacteria group bacterium]MBI3074986.1 hypothetical protein [Parcubacteria group bacterium]
MKKDEGAKKKLIKKDFERMWGEDGPYSQVRLCEETRILDDSVSRVFLVVEAEINPFTFEYVRNCREHFTDDEPVLQLLDHAEYRGKFGYVVSAGEVELRDEESRAFARKQADMTTKMLIRMHAFVMDEYDLRRDEKYGIVESGASPDSRYIWNQKTGRMEPAESELWERDALIGSPAGIRNNKMRFFIMLAFDKNADFSKTSVVTFAKTLKQISARFTVEIEEAESFQEHVLITALIPFDVAPAAFIESVLDGCRATIKKPLFQKDYFVTNVKRPTSEQIMSFLKQLPLSGDIKTTL